MRIFNHYNFKISNVNKFRILSVIYVSVFWTILDFLIVLVRNPDNFNPVENLWVRELIIFLVSLMMGYLFVFRLKKILRNYPLWLNFFLKSLILIASAALITFIIQYGNSIIILKETSS